jgi:hypothetical protein
MHQDSGRTVPSRRRRHRAAALATTTLIGQLSAGVRWSSAQAVATAYVDDSVGPFDAAVSAA